MEIIPAAVPPSGRPPTINLAPRDVTTLADELLAITRTSRRSSSRPNSATGH